MYVCVCVCERLAVNVFCFAKINISIWCLEIALGGICKMYGRECIRIVLLGILRISSRSLNKSLSISSNEKCLNIKRLFWEFYLKICIWIGDTYFCIAVCLFVGLMFFVSFWFSKVGGILISVWRFLIKEITILEVFFFIQIKLIAGKSFCN